jgi:hypothetical protein
VFSKDKMKILITGIDVSKEKPDLCLHSDGQPVSERAVENSTPVIRSSLQGVLKRYGKEAPEVLICAEYTGQYGYSPGCARKELHTGLWMENTAPVKHPSGLVWGKNDKPDALKRAACAVRFQDKVHLFSLPEKKPAGLKQTVSERGMYMGDRSKYQGQLTGQKAVYEYG